MTSITTTYEDLVLTCQDHGLGSSSQLIKFTFLNEKGAVQEQLNNDEFWSRVCSLSQVLSDKFPISSRLIMIYFPGIDFIIALLACFKADLVPIPIPPPDLAQNGARALEESRKFIAIATSSAAVAVLTDRQYDRAKRLTAVRSWIGSWVSTTGIAMAWPDIPWIVTPDFHHKHGAGPYSPVVTSKPIDNVAFLQYTSGSTSAPKGVRLVLFDGNRPRSLLTDVLLLLLH